MPGGIYDENGNLIYDEGDENAVMSGGDEGDQPVQPQGGSQGSFPATLSPQELKDLGPVVQLLGLTRRTGSQGSATPSYTADAASARTRVSKILESNLRNLEGASGLERVGNAAMQVLAGQGRVNFPQAMAAMQQQDVGRAVNIANALSGLAKSENAGAVSPLQLMNLLERQRENARRERTSFQNNIESQIRDLSRRYEDPAAVTAYLRSALSERDAEIKDYPTANKVFAEVAGSLSAQGFKPIRVARGGAAGGGGGGGGGAGGEAGQIGGLYYEDGEAKWKPFTYSGKGQQPEWERLANYIARTEGPEAADMFVRERANRTSGAQLDERQRRGFEFRTGQQANARTDQFNREESKTISTIAGRYGTNATEVEQRMREYIQTQITERGIDVNDINTRRSLLNEAVADLAKSGIKMEPRPQAKKVTEDARIPMLPNGTPNYAASIPNPKDNFGRLWNAATPEQRVGMLERKISETIEGKAGQEVNVVVGPNGETSVTMGKAGASVVNKALNEYVAAQTGYESVKPILSRMEQLIDDGAFIGPLGTLATTLGFVRSAANQLFGNALPDDLRGSDEEIANRFDSVLEKAGLSGSGLSRMLSGRADAPSQALKTNIVFAMYYVAKTLDGTGNLSNNDTRSVLKGLGVGWNSPQAARAAWREVDRALEARVKARWNVYKSIAPQAGGRPPAAAGGQPRATGAAPGATPNAAAPEQKVYPTPSRAAIDALRKGQKPDGTPVTREDFDGHFGPGSAERALRGGD